MVLQTHKEFVMHQEEMKNVMEMHHQDLVMKQQMIQTQQQTMNVFMMSMMGQRNNETIQT